MKKIIFISFILLFAVNCFATTYYVDPGAGSHGSGTCASPFKDVWDITWGANNTYLLKAGTTESLSGAETISVDGVTIGSYTWSAGPICTEDSAGASITRPIVQMTSTQSLFIIDASNFTMRNIHLKGGDDTDVLRGHAYSANESTVTIEYMTIEGYNSTTEINTGIRVGITSDSYDSDSWTVRYNSIDCNSQTDETGHDGISMGEQADSALVYGNDVRDCDHAGIAIMGDNSKAYDNYITDTTGHQDGCIFMEAVDNAATSQEVYHNYCESTNYIQINGVYDSVFHHNVIDCTTGCDSTTGAENGAIGVSTRTSLTTTGNKVYNNTIYNYDTDIHCLRAKSYSGDTGSLSGTVFANNLCHTGGGSGYEAVSVQDLAGIISASDISWYNNNSYASGDSTNFANVEGSTETLATFNARSEASGNTEHDPQLVDVTTAKFWPNGGASNSLDAGYNTGSTYDHYLLSTSDFSTTPPTVVSQEEATHDIGAYTLEEAATYYVREDGTQSFGSTTSCSAAGNAMSVATLEAGSFSGGPHTVVICNEGSEFSSGLIHEELNLTSSHSGAGSGQEITFQCETGETCGFSTTHKYTNTDWEEYSDQSGYTIFYVNTGSSTADYYGARDDGATERNPYISTPCTTAGNYTQDREFCGLYGGGDFFMRVDGDPASNPGTVWVGVREHAIEVNGADWLIFKDLILDGPQGQDSGDDDTTDNALLYIHGDSDNVIAGQSGAGLEIRYGKNDCVDISGSTLSNVTLQHSKIHGCWGGVFIDSTAANSNTQILYNEVYNIATVDGDEAGDRHGITTWKADDVLIKGNYVHDQGHSGMGGTNIDHAILTYASDNIDIWYNYIEEAAKGCIGFGTDPGNSTSNLTAAYNICRNFNKYPVDAGEDKHDGIRADCTIKSGEILSGPMNGVYIFGNLVDGAYTQGGAAPVIGIRVESNANCSSENNYYVTNNLIVNDPDYDYDLYIAYNSVTTREFNNNILDEDGLTNDTDQIYMLSGTESIDTFNGRAYATGNDDADCALQESGGMYYGIDASGGCDGAGHDAGATYDDALDMDSTWDPISIATQQQPASWDIGPWIEGTFDQPAPGIQDIQGLILQ